MKKFNSPKVGGGKTLIGKNLINFYKSWFVNPSISFSIILMAFMSIYFLSCSEVDHAENNQSQYAQTRELADGACAISIDPGCDTMTIDTFVTIDSCEVPV